MKSPDDMMLEGPQGTPKPKKSITDMSASEFSKWSQREASKKGLSESQWDSKYGATYRKKLNQEKTTTKRKGGKVGRRKTTKSVSGHNRLY